MRRWLTTGWHSSESSLPSALFLPRPIGPSCKASSLHIESLFRNAFSRTIIFNYFQFIFYFIYVPIAAPIHNFNNYRDFYVSMLLQYFYCNVGQNTVHICVVFQNNLRAFSSNRTICSQSSFRLYQFCNPQSLHNFC